MKIAALFRIRPVIAGVAIAMLAAGLVLRFHVTPATAASKADTAEVTGPALSPVNPEVNDLQLSEKFQNVMSKIPGGEIAPCRGLEDPYPEFNGIAVDPKNG